MSAEERLKSAGFRKKNESSHDFCLACKYFYFDSDNDKTVMGCKLHGIKFWDDFVSADYICRNFDRYFIDIDSETETLVSDKQKKQSSPKEVYIPIVVYMIVTAFGGGLVGGAIKFFQWVAADLTFGVLFSMPTSDSILPMILKTAAIGAVIGLVIGIFEAINEKRK